MEQFTMSDERGFLTETDRAFLTGEKEYTGENAKQLRYQRRQAIAERARQAFHDFSLLFDVLNEHERGRIFDIDPTDDGVNEYNEFSDALAATIAFLYRSLERDVDSERDPLRQLLRIPFDRVLIEGLKRGEADRYDRKDLPEHRIEVDYGGVEVTEIGDPAGSRGVRKIANDRIHELTEDEMLTIIRRYKPGGTVDFLEDDPAGYARLNERIKELQRQGSHDE